MQTQANPRRFFFAGQSVELWEDPRRPFGCTPHDLEAYCLAARWELLFNAIMIACDACVGADDTAAALRVARCAWVGGERSPASEDEPGH